MKTQPMQHQIVGLDRLKDDKLMLACEQGTGKSFMALADAERRSEEGEIDGLLIIAPNGVHTNWVKREIPTHLSISHDAIEYSSGPSKTKLRQMERFFASSASLHIMSMSIDAAVTINGEKLARRFLQAFKCMMVVDESSTIKNPSAIRTKKIISLGNLAKIRRCLSGTPITNSPADIFSQFEFLGKGMLGTESYRAFVAEYVQLLPPNNRVVLDVVSASNPKLVAEYKAAVAGNHQRLAHDLLGKLARISPQIQAKDANGHPKNKNLLKLKALIAPHTYRVTKAECLDLPEKIFQTIYFELSPEQRRLYDFMDEHLRYEDKNGEITIFSALTKLTKLQQITSGFIMRKSDDGATFVEYIEDAATPRMNLLMRNISEDDKPCIIWARYIEEIQHICKMLKKAGIPFVAYHGSTRKEDREAAIDNFQSGAARVFVGTQGAAGIGLTLTAAEVVYYYSNDFKLINRLQSEDRAHRIGTKHNVVYVDLVANDTIDEKITSALQHKAEVAAFILGDSQ